jgi:hypothetical protein
MRSTHLPSSSTCSTGMDACLTTPMVIRRRLESCCVFVVQSIYFCTAARPREGQQDLVVKSCLSAPAREELKPITGDWTKAEALTAGKLLENRKHGSDTEPDGNQRHQGRIQCAACSVRWHGGETWEVMFTV